ncbi:glycosyltransferase family A protein [Methylophilus sp. OH31]|uniref:glycosyltransferase family 2 protein n=1 Tax=Methylophilus sp. OH31 TaxID=1387312 RepID=UPI0004640431|nr:glycosyltransferase family A protein [Methylophilus sp. OH31]
MHPPLVSIIIPYFNAASYIEECVNSVLNQSYSNIEIIVVDDGSTDHGVDKISHMEQLTIIHQQNAGACVARNQGLEAARGEFVKFLDADDYLEKDCIALQVEEALKHDNNTIVYGNFTIVSKNTLKPVNTRIAPKNQTATLLFSDLLTTTPLHRRYMLEAIGGFDTRFKNGQEWNLHVRLAGKGYKFVHMDKNIYFYRVHTADGRISNKRKRHTGSSIAHEIDKVRLTNEALQSTFAEDMRPYIAMRYWWVGRLALRHGLIAFANIAFNESKLTYSDYQEKWPLYYRFLHGVLGAHLAEKVMSPIYERLGGKYHK